MKGKLFIDGQAGTTGLGIARRAAALPGLSLVTLDDSRRKLPEARAAAMAEADAQARKALQHPAHEN